MRDNYWVMAAMTGVRASIVPIIAAAAMNLVKGAFRYPPCVLVAVLSFGLYLIWNVNCVFLVLMGIAAGLVICEVYERKGAGPMVLLELFWSFLKIGFSVRRLSMIPLISSEMISHGWMTAAEVSDIVAIAEMTPGPLGVNCATFAGIQAAGFPGAIAANLGVLMPTLTLCAAAAVFFERVKGNKYMEHVLVGVRPAVWG